MRQRGGDSGREELLIEIARPLQSSSQIECDRLRVPGA
jgi:hypothetical protein